MTKKINIGIVAHVDAGKTTITEEILYRTGITKEAGRVDKGNTVTDNMELERNRGISIKATTVSFCWKGVEVHLLDTPGHVDFVAEVERSLLVLDAAILVVSAKEGIQSHTKLLYRALQKLSIPTIVFANKIDRMGVDLEDLRRNLVRFFDDRIVAMQEVKVGAKGNYELKAWHHKDNLKKTQESLGMISIDYLEALLAGDDSIQCTKHHIESLFDRCEAIPLLYGSALGGVGIVELLDLIVDIVPIKTSQCLGARVYKIARDKNGSKLCYLRLFGGSLEVRKEYSLANRELTFKIKNLFSLKGITMEQADRISQGGVAIIKTDCLQIGDTIGDTPIDWESNLSIPTLKAKLECITNADRRLLLDALTQISDEDPFLSYNFNSSTQEIEVVLFGMVQREVLIDTLKERFGIRVSIDKPTTIYKERPLTCAEAVLRMYKDTYEPATVGFRVKPLPVDTGFVYLNNVSYGDLKKPFQNAVLEGCQKGLKSDMGWEITDIEVEFFYSEFNSVDSTPSAYRKLAQEVIKIAIDKSKTELLEPLYKVEIDVPTIFVGRAMSDIIAMGGEVHQSLDKGDTSTVIGIVPVHTSKDYSSTLAHYSGGKGIMNTSFSGFRVCNKDYRG